MFRRLFLSSTLNTTKKYFSVQSVFKPKTNYAKMILVSAVLTAGISYALKNKITLKAQEKEKTNHVYKIVLTGGPCGGKSTALDKVKKSLEENGISVYTVPEVATIIFTNGVKWGNISEHEKVQNQKKI